MFSWLAESTWGVPLVAALHVLGIAWFGGLALAPELRLPAWRRAAIAWMVFTGALLFAAHPERTYGSGSFRLKMGLLLALVLLRGRWRWLSLALWGGVIFASRWIAFY
jgi:hypothetical protein